jgi:transposase
MPKRRYFNPTEEQRKELENIRNHHGKPYMREKASALLQIADGKSAHEVALHGLLRARDPDAVYGWLTRYENEGAKGLLVKDGRGRKPAFSPSI